MCQTYLLKLSVMNSYSMQLPHDDGDVVKDIVLVIYVLPGLVNLTNNKIVRLQKIRLQKCNRALIKNFDY